MPAGKMVRVGVWENDSFIGCVLFSRGSTGNIGKPYGLPQTQIVELTRIALRGHRVAVSRIVSIAVRLLKKANPGLRLLVSYADRQQGHHGGIYQAANWLYVGMTNVDSSLCINGEIVHRRTVYSRYGNQGLSWVQAHVDPRATRVLDQSKHKYLMPLDDAMRAQIAPLAKPYPKRATSIGSDAPGVQSGEGGATPTVALHSPTPRLVARDGTTD
jgi:hypothetical protein